MTTSTPSLPTGVFKDSSNDGVGGVYEGRNSWAGVEVSALVGGRLLMMPGGAPFGHLFLRVLHALLSEGRSFQAVNDTGY